MMVNTDWQLQLIITPAAMIFELVSELIRHMKLYQRNQNKYDLRWLYSYIAYLAYFKYI